MSQHQQDQHRQDTQHQNLREQSLGKVFRRHRRGIALTFALLLLTLLAGTGLLGLAGHFLTAAALAGSTAIGFNFFGPSAGIRGLTFARILSRYAEKLVGHDVTLRLARDLRVWLFQRLLPLAPLGLGRHRVGDLLARLIADIEVLDGLLVRAIGPLLALAGLGLIGGVIAFCVLPAVGLLLLIVLLLLGVAVPWASHGRSDVLEHARAAARARLRESVQEGLEGVSDLAALDAVEAWQERVGQLSEQLSWLESRRRLRLAAAGFTHALVLALALPALLWVLFNGVHAQQLGAAAASGLLFMSMGILEACAGIGLAWQAWQAARVSSQRLRDIAAQAPVVVDPVHARAVPAQGALHFDQLSYRWPGSAREVLVDAQLILHPGQRVAIGGDSGQGKSSLLALALRLCDPDRGEVRYGGIAVREFRQADWHRQITWLPQDAPVFAGSVRENLRLGDPDASDEAMWQVLAQVRLEPRFRTLALGLDSWIGESGATLSAGQARRLALARALLRDTPLLLLDEPTEGLDQDTADQLMRDFAQACSGRSVLIISHDTLPAGVVDARYRLADGRLQLVPA